MAASEVPTAPVQEGEVLAAKYRIEQVIGYGGMGVVVSAMHLELDQRVAVKFLLPQAAQSAELVGRFVREAKASAKLKGNHVTKVLDVGQMTDGRAYMVMEYLEGRDLAEQLKADDSQFEIKEAVSWVLQACEGLAEAHALGIIHRDLKPGNLFLAKTDQRITVKVLDFGISKSINPNSSDFGSLTKTEMLLGSPLYMAPEQMRSSKYVDERSDIWALGAIAYELLCRRVPFEADTLLDLCFKVAQETCRPIHEVRPEVSPELSAVVMRCLEKDAELRWNDIGELARALEPFAHERDRGSAERTVKILEGGALRVTKKKSGPGSSRTSQPSPFSTLKTKPAEVPEASDVAVGTAATERASVPQITTAESPTSKKVSDVSEASEASEADVPDVPPPSSAWGTTNAREKPVPPQKSSRTAIVAVAGVALAAVVGVVMGQRGDKAAPSPAATVTAAAPPPSAEPPAPVPPPTAEGPAPTAEVPAPTAEPTPSAAVSAPTAIAPSARPTAQAPAPKPSAKPSASAAPAASQAPGGFIRERE